MNLRNSVPTIIGRFTYLAGIADILANVLTPVKLHAKQLDKYLPIFVNSAAFATAIFTGVALIILARNLIRRKRRAWALAIGFLILNIVSDLFRLHYHPYQVSGAVFLLIFTSAIYPNATLKTMSISALNPEI